jgi:hypothetical protein
LKRYPASFSAGIRSSAASSPVGAYSSMQWEQISRTSRWAMMPMIVEVIRKWGMPRSSSRVSDDGASLVCSVDSTRWPVTFVAVDMLGAGVGDYVLLTQGSSARLTPETKNMPVDAVVVGIVDQVHVDSGMVYSRETK